MDAARTWRTKVIKYASKRDKDRNVDRWLQYSWKKMEMAT